MICISLRTRQGLVICVVSAATFLNVYLSPALVFAEDVFAYGAGGAIGTPGADGPSGSDGGDGQPGMNAMAVADEPIDSSNHAFAAGGVGGAGGFGGSATSPGGTGGDGGDAGAAGSAYASATATAPAPSVSATAEAYGGGGGVGGAGGTNGSGSGTGAGGLASNGASARATASANNSAIGGSAHAMANAAGGAGAGGNAYPGGENGGNGGPATIDTLFASANGGIAQASATANGGTGGATPNDASLGGIGGNGAPVMLFNKVSGATTGELYLSQVAIGGSAGHGGQLDGMPGTAGAAMSTLTLTNTVASSINGTVQASGGEGGISSSSAPGGSGAPATASIDITGKGPIQANAASSGGNGGFARSSQGGVGGDATATARGASTTAGNVTTRGDAFAGFAGGGPTHGLAGRGVATADAITAHGYVATAQAAAIGGYATVTANSRTSGGPISSISVTGNATDHGNLNAQTIAAIGDGFSWPGGPAWHSLGNTWGLPSPGNVTNELTGDPNVTAAYNASSLNHTPLALLELQTNTPGNTPAATPTLSVTAHYSFDLSQLITGNLMIGLLDPTSSGPGFTSLHFTIEREGATVEDQTFTTLATAMIYFNDHVLDLGDIDTGVVGMLDLSISLEMVSPDNKTGFNTTLLIADVGPNILPGDYNDDGTVNAADYVIWRHHQGTSNALPNDPTGGVIGAMQLNTWRAHFGQTIGSGAGASTALPGSAVPEPAGVTPIVAATVSFLIGRFIHRNFR